MLHSITTNNIKPCQIKSKISNELITNVSPKQSLQSLNLSQVKIPNDKSISSFSSSLSSIEFMHSISQSKYSSKIINSQVITEDVNERYPNLLIKEIEGKCLNKNNLIITPAGLKNSPRYYGDGIVFFGRKLFDDTNKYIINDVILVNLPTFHPLYKYDNHFFVIFFNSKKRTYFIRTYTEQFERDNNSDEVNSCEKTHSFSLNYFMVKIVSPYILSNKEFIVINDKVMFVEISSLSNDYSLLNIMIIPKHNKKTEMKSYVFSSQDKKRVVIGRETNCDIVFENNKNISKIHCTFYYKSADNKWVIKDGGDKKSLNGTYIMPRHSYELKDGCEIKTLANSKFKIKFVYKKQNPEIEHLEKITIYDSNSSSEIF